jgi:hypothetical protein
MPTPSGPYGPVSGSGSGGLKGFQGFQRIEGFKKPRHTGYVNTANLDIDLFYVLKASPFRAGRRPV